MPEHISTGDFSTLPWPERLAHYGTLARVQDDNGQPWVAILTSDLALLVEQASSQEH